MRSKKERIANFRRLIRQRFSNDAKEHIREKYSEDELKRIAKEMDARPITPLGGLEARNEHLVVTPDSARDWLVRENYLERLGAAKKRSRKRAIQRMLTKTKKIANMVFRK
ncbi:MAG TPA: hypothetical protein HA222_01470 [Candidatus Diapherotrites archaeon]|uniref:Uncharacterized protein n=1 Tax=Candidatus Iainarchaeum sp. TaxID=3101447 RepID=A0A7J4JV21_9ARCH|nr:hypothetical protein [Candidatus Diapherotrites archaeon]